MNFFGGFSNHAWGSIAKDAEMQAAVEHIERQLSVAKKSWKEYEERAHAAEVNTNMFTLKRPCFSETAFRLVWKSISTMSARHSNTKKTSRKRIS